MPRLSSPWVASRVAVIAHDYQAGLDQDLLVVYDESATSSRKGEDQSGNHYSPLMDQNLTVLGEDGFTIQTEAKMDDYHHFQVEK